MKKVLQKLIFKRTKYITFKYPSNVKYKIVKETKLNYYIQTDKFLILPAIQRVSKTVRNILFIKYKY